MQTIKTALERSQKAMKRQQSKGRGNKGKYTCPFCGTVYSIKSMAEKCAFSPECRKYNFPSKEMIRRWNILAGVASLGLFISGAIIDHATNVDKLPEAKSCQVAKDFREICLAFCRTLRITHPIPRRYADEEEEVLQDAICRVWPANSMIDPVVVLEVFDAIFVEASHEFKQLPGEEKTAQLLDAMDAVLMELHDAVLDDQDEGVEDATTDQLAAIEILREGLWGTDTAKAERKPSCYIVGDRWWVAAYSRADAKECIRRKYGLVHLSVEGVPLGERLEDGRLVSDLVAMASDIPQVVGDCER